MTIEGLRNQARVWREKAGAPERLREMVTSENGVSRHEINCAAADGITGG